jgi:hypothetical protein
LEQDLAKTPQTSRRLAGDTPRPDKDSSDSIVFLGRQVTQSDYQEICRNLGEFFKLLRKWAEEARRNAETDTQE